MINISPVDNDYRKGFLVQGHAGYAQSGFDIVCASVSTMVRMAYNTLARTNILTINFADGYSYIQIHNPSDASDLVVQGFIETVEELQGLHPEHVKMEGDSYYVTE